MRSDAKFCSEQCNNRAHAATRKMWQRLGIPKGDVPLVSRKYLADRDGLKCHLCNLRLSLLAKHPNPGYASIDHVIPLSAGGTNDLANLRLAHLVCNLRKRAKAMGEQLALIG
jgi:5-methylcytosine-specific restriction endonuclease McrA